MVKHKVILLIRDGWGYRDTCKKNAICQASTPNNHQLKEKYPNTLLKTSGEAVGLPPGYQGNSEIGHITLSSGRIVLQPLKKINESIKDGSFFKKQPFLKAIEKCKEEDSTLHLMGLLQEEGVHSHIKHLFALLDLCKRQGFEDVLIHAFTDGRDAPVTESVKHVSSLLDKLEELGFGKIATISGRYYPMDRDKNWDRTKKAYDCIIKGKSEKESFGDPLKKIKECHSQGETDEFIIPRKAKWYKGVKDGDSMVFFNFRTDRPRQLTKAIIKEDFESWNREEKPDVFFVTMTEYYDEITASVAFEKDETKNLLGEVISNNGLKQLRISETQKYAHVTFFFNGQEEEPYPKEERILIPSPKVPTYNLKPEMSVYKITKRLVKEINRGEYSFIVVNLVNCDMVGHTGKPEAIKKAVSAVDDCVGKIVNAGLKKDYTLLVLADHGNAEDQTEERATSHTLNPVPCILVSNDPELKNSELKENQGLKDVAPTVLQLIGIEKPEEMTGECIIEK